MPAPSTPSHSYRVPVRVLRPEDEFRVGSQQIPGAPPGIRFTVADRQIDLYRTFGSGRWRLMVDGLHLAMSFRESQAHTTNAGRYDSEQEASEVEFLPIGGDGPLGIAEFEIRRVPGGIQASGSWGGRTAEIYNTVIYEYHHLVLAFPDDFSRIAVELSHSMDSSS